MSSPHRTQTIRSIVALCEWAAAREAQRTAEAQTTGAAAKGICGALATVQCDYTTERASEETATSGFLHHAAAQPTEEGAR